MIGAGPAGSATATHLARAGLSVLLLDRARFPRPKPCAEYVSPGAVEAMERLGALPRVLAEDPAPVVGMRVVGPDGRGFTGRFVRGIGLGVPRVRLDFHLASTAAAAGAQILQGVTFESLTLTPGSVRVLARAGKHTLTFDARIAIGADGLNSRVAHRLGLARRGGPSRVALVAHARGVRDMGDMGEMHVGPAGYAGLAPLGHGLTNVAVVVDLARDRVARPLSTALTRHLARVPSLGDRLADVEWVTPAAAAGPFGRSTRRASADRTLLVGDAADFYDPFTGEGVYAALRGAELAAECAAVALERDRLSAGDLAAYDAARRKAFTAKWTLERIVSAVISHPRALGHVAARLARRPGLGDLLVSVAAHAAPPGMVCRPSVVWRLAS